MKNISKKMRQKAAVMLAVIMILTAVPTGIFANVVNNLAEVLVPPSLTFEQVYHFRFDGTALVGVNEQLFAVNKEGQFVATEDGDYWSWYDSSVYATFWEDGLFGVENRFGDVVAPAIYESIVLGEMGLAWVRQNGLWGILQLPDYLDNAFGPERAAIIRAGTGRDGFADNGYEIWSIADGAPEDGFIGELPYADAPLRVVSHVDNANFITAGPFGEFAEVWLYSHEEGTLTRLWRGWEYVVEEGSTRITLRDHALQDAPQGENTLVVEFRVRDDAASTATPENAATTANPVRIAAQSFENPMGRPVRRPAPPVLLQHGTHIATRDVNVRSGPSPDHAAIGWIPRGSTVEVIEQVNPWWVRVRFANNRIGFVNSPFLASRGLANVEGATPRTVATHRLNVRSGPGTSHSYVGVLHRGDVVQQLERVSGGWIRISYNHNGFIVTGYVHGHYLR